MEYILILVDRYISEGKSTIIAKLYLSYLDNKINWKEFSMYSEVTDQLFMDDLDFLRNGESQIISEVSSDAWNLYGYGWHIQKLEQNFKDSPAFAI